MRFTLATLLLSISLISTAQNTPIIRNIVFEGAGIRGIAYCGAINELESRDLIRTTEKFGGTSAGAIVALTLALGYSANEIESIIRSTNFKRFNDGSFLGLGAVHRLSKYYGWYKGKRFEKWISQIIERKTGNAEISFEELHTKGFKDLYIIGTCLNKQSTVSFSHETYPEMKVRDAIRISMSIPLYFKAVFIDSLGHLLNRPSKNNQYDVMIDGGLTGNFPIKAFDSNNTANPATIGFRIDSDDQIRMDSLGGQLAAMPIINFRQYLTAFYTMIMENLNRQQLTREDWKRTISISDGQIGPRIRKLSSKEIRTLIDNGQRATKTYLN